MANPDPFDYQSLLCEHCKAVVVAAKAAHDALANLHALTNGQAVLPTLPATLQLPAKAPERMPWEGKHPRDLTREERLAKGRHILNNGVKQPQLHQTSNGTITAQPWQGAPRKKITAAAERDIDKVIEGKWTRAQWCAKHGYSSNLLEKRIAMRKGTATGIVPGYKSEADGISDADVERVLNNEISGLALSRELRVNKTSIYRAIERYKKANKPTTKAPGALGRLSRTYTLTPQELQQVIDGKSTNADLAQKHGCSESLVSLEVGKLARSQGREYNRNSMRWELPEKATRNPTQPDLFAEKAAPASQIEKTLDSIAPPPAPANNGGSHDDMFDRLTAAIS